MLEISTQPFHRILATKQGINFLFPLIRTRHKQLIQNAVMKYITGHVNGDFLSQIRPSQLAAAAHSSKRPKSTTVGGIGSVGKSEADYTMDHFRSEISIAYKRAGVNVSHFL